MGMKFIRGLIYPNANSAPLGLVWRLKWAYEFWGFCVNGTSSLTLPGGFAANNGVTMPANFIGGTSLMTSGSDGSHPAVPGETFSGDCLFTAQSSTPFLPTMVGKALVMWKPISNSSEDSIYVITQFISTNQIIININTGGVPNATTKHPSMTARTDVNYRVVDMVASTSYTGMNGSYLVFQTDAESINAGQANSQFQFVNLGTTSASLIGVGLSGTGSWNGAAYSISGATNLSPITITTTAPHSLVTGQTATINGVAGNTAANGNWLITNTGSNTFSLTGSTGNGTFSGSSGIAYSGFANDGYTAIYSVNPEMTTGTPTQGQTAVNCIADKTFFINHIRDQALTVVNYQSHWHFEIPQRLYPQGNDLHPMSIMIGTNITGLTTSSTTASYGGGFVMKTHTSDITAARNYRTLVKALRGDGTPDVFGQNLTDFRLGINSITGLVPSSDGILCLPGISNQFTLARAKLRTVKFTGTSIPSYHRVGLNGEWMQIQNGICWPWDNTIIPFQLLLFGV